jgi:beta-lactam-binding protein with PASTA domain
MKLDTARIRAAFRALGPRLRQAWARVKAFRLPLDLSRLQGLDREHWRIAAYLFGALILLMAALGFVAFSLSLRGQERTMVPELRGMELAQGLVRMQEKELYPRLSLRFTDEPKDKGLIVEQRPLPGAIVKAGRRISLVVSRGPVVDRVESYVGQDLNEVNIHLQTIFAGTRPLLTVKEPLVYVFDASVAGTILEQKPPAGTELSGPVALELVVSRGPEKSQILVPDLQGLAFPEALLQVEKANLPALFQMRKAESREKPGIVVSQTPMPGTRIAANARATVVVTAPLPEKGMVGGVFQRDLPEYPYPLRLVLEALLPTGDRTPLLRVNHPGGPFSAPYLLPEGSVLVLTVLDREMAREEVKSP